MQVDSGISQAARDANKISVTKKVFGDTTLTAEKSSFKRNTTDLWQEFGFFKQQPCDYGTEKENHPETQCSTFIRPISLTRTIKRFITLTIFLLDK